MTVDKSIVLITGANAGIGFELVLQLLSDSSKHVILGSRDISKGKATMAKLESGNISGSLELLQIDVSSADSIHDAAWAVERKYGRLDALVNTAALRRPSGSLAEQFAQCFQINATGAFLVIEAFLRLLKKSKGTSRIINVSCGDGSIRGTLDLPSRHHDRGVLGVPYCASKAALNLITASQSTIYGKEGVKVFAYTPGLTASGLGPHNNVESPAQPTSDGTAPMVKILNGERDNEHAGFLGATGQYPW